MAHSHSNTLLAKLGFGDADKADSRHDAACRYMMQGEPLHRAASLFIPTNSPDAWESGGHPKEEYRGNIAWRMDVIRQPQFEVPLSKGSGQYKTTIGFIDAAAICQVAGDWTGEKRVAYAREWSDWTAHECPRTDSFTLLLEVKVHKVSAAEILRQINLYREYWSGYREAHWLVVTDFGLLASEVEQLASAKIRTGRLGSDFDSWHQFQQTTELPTLVEF